MDWLSNNVNAIIIGIISGLFSAALVKLIALLSQSIAQKKSEFTGTWEQLIYNANDDTYSGEIIKRDIYDLKHIKVRQKGKISVNVRGTIERHYPAKQRGRRWSFIGYLNGRVMTILYESTKTQASRGCIYLMLDYHNGINEFRGFYLEEHDDGIIDKTPLILRKIQNNND